MSGSMQGSSYKVASDIAKGYLNINMVMLKRTAPATIKSILFELRKELNSIRASIVPADDEEGIRDKNLKISRINSAMRLIDVYMRKNKLNR